jgi:ferritin-like protein
MTEVTLQDAVRNFASGLAQKLNTFITDVAELEVCTYTAAPDEIKTSLKDNVPAEAQASLRAYTRISFDGDTTVVIPVGAGGAVDPAIWELHQNAVRQAITNRTMMIQTIGEAAASALRALGLAGSMG